MIFIQVSCLFQYELPILSKINSEFDEFRLAAIDDTTIIVLGKPYGGKAIFIRKNYRNIVAWHNSSHTNVHDY